MTHQEQLDLIRQKCIKANPEKEWRPEEHSYPYDEAVRLADVLLAIKGQIFAVTADGEFIRWPAQRTDGRWNLRKDDLTEQTPECVTFLADLLK